MKFHFSFFLFSILILACPFNNLLGVANITAVPDTGATLVNTTVAGESGGETALEMNYSLGSGNFVVAVVDFSTQNFQSVGGNAVGFRYKATGQSNTFEIKFTDSDSTGTLKSDKLVLKFLTIPDNTWRTVFFPLAAFDLFPDGNSSFDLSKVRAVTLGLSKADSSSDSGTVWVDQLELLKSTFTLIDDFQDQAEPNFFGGNNLNAWNGGGSPLPTVSYTSLGGDKVYRCDWSNSVGGYSGFFMNLYRNLQGYTHLSFRVRGDAGGEVIKAKLESFAGSTELFISTYLPGGITTTFQTVKIPLSAFSNVNFSTVTTFTGVTVQGFGPASGTVYFDDIAFIRENETPQTIEALDDFETDQALSPWSIYTSMDTSLSVSLENDSTVPGATGLNRVYRLDYNFKTPPSAIRYAVIEKPLYSSLAESSELRFRYKGTGAVNNFELKLVDSDNTTWYKKFLMFTDTGGSWKSATVPLSQFVLFSSGNDSNLNLREIKKIEYAVSKGSGGSGIFTIDTLLKNTSDLTQNRPGRLITAIRVVNNPFSPNGDGIKEDAFFVYTLDAPSKVNLKIYSLDGQDIKTVGSLDQSAGEQSLSWNGTDNSGAKVSNGMYLFRLEAEGFDNRKDVAHQVIGVLR